MSLITELCKFFDYVDKKKNTLIIGHRFRVMKILE